VGEQWPERPSTRWVLLDAAGEVLEKGESDALRWPTADFCEAVIAAADMSCLRAKLPPRVSRRDLPLVVAGILEDQLFDDSERSHLTLATRRQDIVDVLVISRLRLRNVVAQFVALQRPLASAYSELQVLPAASDEWMVALAYDAVMLLRPGFIPVVLDGTDDGAPSALFETLVRNAEVPDRPSRLVIRPEPGRKVDLGSWKNALGSDLVSVGDEYNWYAVPSGSANLLHDEFVSGQRRNPFWQLIKPAAAVAASALLTYVVVGLILVGWQSIGISRSEARIADLFRSSFPGVPVVAPVAQARRSLDQLRGFHGLPRSDDALTLLAALADECGGDATESVRSITFRERRLTVVLEPRLASQAEAIRQRLSLRGYQVIAATTPQGLPSLVIAPETTR
jgi:type II secretion system protein L